MQFKIKTNANNSKRKKRMQNFSQSFVYRRFCITLISSFSILENFFSDIKCLQSSMYLWIDSIWPNLSLILGSVMNCSISVRISAWYASSSNFGRFRFASVIGLDRSCVSAGSVCNLCFLPLSMACSVGSLFILVKLMVCNCVTKLFSFLLIC